MARFPNPDQRIVLTFDDDAPILMTVAEFLDANEDSDETFDALCAVRDGEEYRGGGGAGCGWTLKPETAA
jgi:hypothetical protein